MNILFFSHYFPPEVNAPATRTYDHCKRWVRAGHKVTVITCAPNCPSGVVYEGYRNKLYQREKIDGINVIRIWTYLAANRGFIRRVMNYFSYMIMAFLISLLQKKPDIIISTSPQFFCGWAGILSGWFKRSPCILEIRDIWPESIEAASAMGNRAALRFLEFLEKKMYACAHHIVAVGEGYKANIAGKGVPPEKITIITNGADMDMFAPMPPDSVLCDRYGLNDHFTCAYIGTIGLCSCLEVINGMAAELRDRNRNDIKILVVGDGAVKERLENEAKEMGLENIIYTGLQEKKMMPSFISVSDACIAHLKKHELFQSVLPSKIFESSAMGKPVILGVEGDAEELIKKAQAGICVEPENPGRLADAVVTLADDPELTRTLGDNGHRYVKKNYNRDVLAEKYLELIEKLITRK